MAFFDFIENFFFVSLGITFALIILLVYHFKQRISSMERKGDTMYELITNVVKELQFMKQLNAYYETLCHTSSAQSENATLESKKSESAHLSDSNLPTNNNIVLNLSDQLSNTNTIETSNQSNHADNENEYTQPNTEEQTQPNPTSRIVVSDDETSESSGSSDENNTDEYELEYDTVDEEDEDDLALSIRINESQLNNPLDEQTEVDLECEVLNNSMCNDVQITLQVLPVEDVTPNVNEVIDNLNIDQSEISVNTSSSYHTTEHIIEHELPNLNVVSDVCEAEYNSFEIHGTTVEDSSLSANEPSIINNEIVEINVTEITRTPDKDIRDTSEITTIELVDKKQTREVYRKMNITQLKGIALAAGISTDITKMKKIELIQLLENLED